VKGTPLKLDDITHYVAEILKKQNVVLEKQDTTQGTINSMAETGAKIPIPVPDKVSGEGDSIDIRLGLKQIERYLQAKGKPRSEWGTLAFAFVEKGAASVWNAELTDLERDKKEATWDIFTRDNDFLLWNPVARKRGAGQV